MDHAVFDPMLASVTIPAAPSPLAAPAKTLKPPYRLGSRLAA
jgi:hypothetical protein